MIRFFCQNFNPIVVSEFDSKLSKLKNNVFTEQRKKQKLKFCWWAISFGEKQALTFYITIHT